MKKISIAFTVIVAALLALSSCSSYNYTAVHYENYELVSDALSFTLKKVPEEENYIAFAALDGEMGQIEYEILDGYGDSVATLTYSQATAKYAESYKAETGGFGISGKAITTASSKEKIGSFTVEFRTDANSAVAVWDETDFSYSLVLTFRDEAVKATTSEVYEYAVALIATR